jgi:hypothetical protein
VSSSSGRAAPSEVTKHFRMSLHLTQVAGRWLVSRVDIFGTPT